MYRRRGGAVTKTFRQGRLIDRTIRVRGYWRRNGHQTALKKIFPLKPIRLPKFIYHK